MSRVSQFRCSVVDSFAASDCHSHSFAPSNVGMATVAAEAAASPAKRSGADTGPADSLTVTGSKPSPSKKCRLTLPSELGGIDGTDTGTIDIDIDATTVVRRLLSGNAALLSRTEMRLALSPDVLMRTLWGHLINSVELMSI